VKVPFHPDYYVGRKAIDRNDKEFHRLQRVFGQCMYEVLHENGNIRSEEEAKKIQPEIAKKWRNTLSDSKSKSIFEIFFMDEAMCRFASNAEYFQKQGDRSKIYMFNKKFLTALSKMDVELRKELLPDNFSGYFAFEPGILDDADGVPIIGAYVAITKPNEKYREPVKSSDMVLKISLVTKLEDDGELGISNKHHFGDISSLFMGVSLGKKFDENLRIYNVSSASKDKDVYRTVINAVMYIHSQNPDVTCLKPYHKQTSREQKTVTKSGFDLNDSAFDVVYVSWNYGKDTVYSKESTVVKTHLRWQPCGPGKGQTKLIIVKEHERHYSNVAKNPERDISV